MNKLIDEQMDRLRALAAQSGNGRLETGIPRVAMVRGAIPEHELATVYEPMINLILQGSKSMTVGEQTFGYDPATYFVMSVELPAIGVIRSDAAGSPYMAVALTLVPSILAELIGGLPPGCAKDRGNAFSVAAVTPELLDAWTRMLGLMARPADIAALAPAYEREILYRVLQGPHGAMLCAIAAPDSAMARLAAAITWIRRDFNLPLRVEALAARAAMSVSAFHRHFKAATSLTSGPVPEAHPPDACTHADGGQGQQRRGGRLRCRLRKRDPVQPGIRAPVRDGAVARRRAHAGAHAQRLIN